MPCVVALAGCKVEADVTVTLDADGTGTIDTFITLDAEAVARVEVFGRTLETAFPLDDMRAAGWEISPWERGADGAATLRLQQDYSGEEELQARITELVGPTNMLRDVEVLRDRGFFRSHDELSIVADLTAPGAGILQDPELTASLQAAGLDATVLDQELQAELRESLTVSLTVQAPDGREQTVQVFGGDEEGATAGRSAFDRGRLIWIAIAAILAFLGVLLYLSASIGVRKERLRRAEVDANARPVERTPLM